ADAGQMLLVVCKENISPQPVEIGSYRGFRMEVCYDTMWNEYRLNLCGSRKHQVSLGSDALGNLTRIENALSKLPAALEVAKSYKDETIEQMGNAKIEIKKPFAYKDELKDKTDRLNTLNVELNLDEKDTSAVDIEPEQSDEPLEKKCASRER
ncbi:MAG TPA: helicase, partial [Ruminococcaceae bacterium]|nr:helicase [Oscillospiraceae bacterium]